MKVVIYWFRKSLRLHDNPALVAALKRAEETKSTVLPIFCLDPYFVQKARVGVLRWVFLLESLADLDQQLRSMTSRLLVIRGEPSKVFERLFAGDKLSADSLYFERDTEPYALERDDVITKLALSRSVKVVRLNGHTLYDPEAVIWANGGKTPLRYQSFLKAIEKLAKIEPALEAPKTFHPLEDAAVDLLREILEDSTGEDGYFGVPTLDQLGLSPPVKPSPHRGGETFALARMKAYVSDKKKVATFEKPKTRPTAFNPIDTTVLSPYLKFGCLSSRLFYHELCQVLREVKQHSQPPVSLLGQLYWREFYYTAAFGTKNYHKMAGNPICLKVDWMEAKSSSDKGYDLLDAWTNARTGFPWIDAAMTQLRTEGWIHHLARHAVACFLTRGDLYVSWERGAEVFDELLLDSDPALNYGNWMWLSASAFFHQYFRVYSPVSFVQKWDPKGLYVKRYIPALKNFPEKYIYEPWKAPIEAQRNAGCIIGKDYPKPIVDHDEARKKCLTLMKQAYERGLNGDGSSRKSGAGSANDNDGDDDGETPSHAGSAKKKTKLK